jgi:hypothetical protein
MLRVFGAAGAVFGINERRIVPPLAGASPIKPGANIAPGQRLLSTLFNSVPLATGISPGVLYDSARYRPK